MNRVYFRNLSALRFFAATAVIFHHVEQYKFWAGIPSAWGNHTIDALGSKAVSFFFVLSGFLITYLLLEEHRKTSDISIRDFYIRRVLRIWPLYYLIVGVSLVVVPALFDLSYLGLEFYDSHFALKTTLLLLVMPNVLRVFSPNIAGANQLWSIGVEEQFYIMWPWLIRGFVRWVLPFLLGFICLKIIVTIILAIYLSVEPGRLLAAAFRFWVLFKVEQMAIGAIGAWTIFYQKERILTLVYNRLVWFASIMAVVVFLVAPGYHWTVSYLEALVFIVIILNLSTNPSLKISLEHPILTTLGNMSYGIYMYHTLCITVCLYALTAAVPGGGWSFNLLLYVSSIGLTLLISYLSYTYFEMFFLGLKERFMVIKSGKKNALRKESPHPDRHQ